MMRSLYSGVSGLKTHQTKMDVIGNNIANVNTVAYKSQSVTFQDLMYQTVQAATGANAATGVGGTNAKQIGLGVTTGAISTAITTAGASQTTNNPFDIRITGDSFFIVNNGSENLYTRAGNFEVDGTGNLVMSTTGYCVMGWQADDDGNIIKANVSPLKVMSTENLTSDPEATTLARMTGIVDTTDPQVSKTDGQTINISIYDSMGFAYTAQFSIHKDGTDDDGAFYLKLDKVLNSDKEDILVGLPAATVESLFGGEITLKDGTTTHGYLIQYDIQNQGILAGIRTDANATATDTSFTLNLSALNDGATATDVGRFSDVTVDMSGSKNQNNDGACTITGKGGNADGLGTGRKIGAMTGISIDTSGKIYGSYDNGDTKLLGQIAVASFANAAGLEKVGNNLYTTTLNSGEFDGIGQDITADGGSMATGVLEMSNVDLSTEFTEMITTQRGFQANSRIITVSDTLLEELTNLKR